MIAQKVFENIHFQRGIEPKRSLKLGKYRSLLLNALMDPDNQVSGELSEEGFKDWLKENPTILNAIEYDTNPLPLDNYLTFDLDFYTEENDVDREDLVKEFTPLKLYGRKKSGEVIVKGGVINIIPKPNQVLYYQGGNVDGFLTRKDWIGLNESINFERGIEPKKAMNIGITQAIFNKWASLVDEKDIRALSLEKSLNGRWHLEVVPFMMPVKKVYRKVMDSLGHYLNTGFRRKADDHIFIMIKPEFANDFIQAYNLRYPKFAIQDKDK